jgi:hypothetical protein
MPLISLSNKGCKATQRALVASGEPLSDLIYTRIEEALNAEARERVVGRDTAEIPNPGNHPDERARRTIDAPWGGRIVVSDLPIR